MLAPGAPRAKTLLPHFTERGSYKALERPPGVPDDGELEQRGAVIGRIIVRNNNIFDTDNPDENTVLFRLGNRLHIRTREATIRDRLLFHPGDRYRGRTLAETERLLREAPQLYDARVRPIAWHNGVVDIEVRTRDVWTLNPGISFGRAGGKNSGGIELEERNLLGLGTELQLAYKSSVDRDSIRVNYHDSNVGSSWWDLNLTYADNSDGQARDFSLQQPFYAFDTRRSMGGSIGDGRRIESRYDLGEIVDQFEVESRGARLFLGWSDGLRDGWVTRLTVGLSFEHDRFNPVAGKYPTRTLPAERKLAYPWIAWERRQEKFRKDRNRDQIRRTEDLSLGWRMDAMLGLAIPSLGADRNAWIFSAAVEKGFDLTPRQTLLLSADVDGRVEHGSGRDIRLSQSLRYYFRQSFHRLTFLSLESSVDVDPDADRQLLLGGDNGLRGYPLRYQGGEGYWLLTAEQRLYTNWYPFRLFNIGAAIFADAGAAWGDNPFGSKPQGLLRDVGFGLRLGNSRSALGQIIHVDFAFPLDGGDDISRFQFLVTTKKSF